MMSIDPHTGVVVTDTSNAELALQERIRLAQQDAVSEVLLPAPSPDLVQRVIEDAEGFAEAATTKYRHPDSPKVACTSGCSHCCYQFVGVLAPEKARMIVFNAVRQGLQDGLAIAIPNSDSKWLELTAAVATTLDNADAEDGWLTGKDIFGKSRLNHSAKI